MGRGRRTSQCGRLARPITARPARHAYAAPAHPVARPRLLFHRLPPTPCPDSRPDIRSATSRPRPPRNNNNNINDPSAHCSTNQPARPPGSSHRRPPIAVRRHAACSLARFRLSGRPTTPRPLPTHRHETHSGCTAFLTHQVRVASITAPRPLPRCTAIATAAPLSRHSTARRIR